MTILRLITHFLRENVDRDFSSLEFVEHPIHQDASHNCRNTSIYTCFLGAWDNFQRPSTITNIGICELGERTEERNDTKESIETMNFLLKKSYQVLSTSKYCTASLELPLK